MTHTILWHRIDHPGHEFSQLSAHNQGWKLQGTALFIYEKQPCKLDYEIFCDQNWKTVSATVVGQVGDRKVNLRITTDEEKWWMNKEEYPEIEGCIDIDLGFSPSTNILPIRRLSMPVGEQAKVRAAWLSFPALEFEPLDQVYSRETDTTYRYESAGGQFVRVLDVNKTGFVTKYPGLWEVELAT